MKSHKQKIEILRSILLEYAKYFRYFSSVRVYDLGLRFCIKFFDYKPKDLGNGSFIRKIPSYDIDKIISRYRSKLDYEIKKRKEEIENQKELLNWCYSIMNLK